MEDIRETIFALSLKGYSCSQILMILSFELRDIEDELLIKSLAGLSMGLYSGKECGTLTGGCCVLASYFLNDYTGGLSEEGKTMIQDFVSWFEESNTCTQCSDILQNGTRDKNTVCPPLIENAFLKIVDILEKNNIDIAE